jgi:hypothetical protein
VEVLREAQLQLEGLLVDVEHRETALSRRLYDLLHYHRIYKTWIVNRVVAMSRIELSYYFFRGRRLWYDDALGLRLKSCDLLPTGLSYKDISIIILNISSTRTMSILTITSLRKHVKYAFPLRTSRIRQALRRRRLLISFCGHLVI